MAKRSDPYMTPKRVDFHSTVLSFFLFVLNYCHSFTTHQCLIFLSPCLWALLSAPPPPFLSLPLSPPLSPLSLFTFSSSLYSSPFFLISSFIYALLANPFRHAEIWNPFVSLLSFRVCLSISFRWQAFHDNNIIPIAQ